MLELLAGVGVLTGVATLAAVAQTGEAVQGVDDLLVTYGPFAPFAALLLYILRVLWQENRDLRTKLDTTNEKITDRMVPLVLDATRLLSEVSDRQMDASQAERLFTLLEELAPPAPRAKARGR